MKKALTVLTLLFAFTISASAQDREINSEEAAKIDAYKLSEYLELKGTAQDDFMRLFAMKHEVLSDPNMSEERKAEMIRVTGLKVRASLTPEQLKKLDANPELYARITSDESAQKTKKGLEKTSKK